MFSRTPASSHDHQTLSPCSALAVFLFVCAAGIHVRAQVPDTFHPPLAILKSTHAEGSISEEHARQALWYAAAELKVPADKVPRILLVQSGPDAVLAGAWGSHAKRSPSGAVLIEPTVDGEKVYYLWVFGKPADGILAQGFVEILEKESGAGESDSAAAAKHVASRLASVVRADDLKQGFLDRH